MIPTKKIKIPVLVITALLGGVSLSQGAEVFSNARTTLQKWVETRQIIARERTAWMAESKTLTENIEFMKNEIAALNQAITEAKADINTQDDTQKELKARIGESKAAVEVAEAAIPVFEKKLLELATIFPDSFKEKVATQMRRIPDPKSNRAHDATVDERLQNIISILENVEYFNKTINLSSELRTHDGETLEVKTVYVGFGQAYFVDEGKTTAGYGYPVIGKGWEWVQMPEIAEAVTNAILVADSRKPAIFVSVPVMLKD